jgi:hypothetical protein
MRREEAMSFAVTAGAVLVMNAVLAVALGYAIHAVGCWWSNTAVVPGRPEGERSRA